MRNKSSKSSPRRVRGAGMSPRESTPQVFLHAARLALKIAACRKFDENLTWVAPHALAPGLGAKVCFSASPAGGCIVRARSRPRRNEARRFSGTGNFYQAISMRSLTRSLPSVIAKRMKRECPHWRTTKRGCQRCLTVQATANVW